MTRIPSRGGFGACFARLPAWKLLLTALMTGSGSASAQILSGVVSDSTGAPVAYARILVRPAGDASDVSLRVATSNDRGEYRVALGAAGSFRASVVRIGFRPSREIDIVVAAADLKQNFILAALPAVLATIEVNPKERQCVPLSSPEQSEDVRDLLRLARGMLHVRRVLEREFTYTVEESSTFRGRDGERTVTRSFTQAAGDTARLRREEEAAIKAIGLALPSGATVVPRTSEVTILSSAFERRVCFENAVTEDAGLWRIRFSQLRVPRGELGVSGSIHVTSDGMVSSMEIVYRAADRRIGGIPYTFVYAAQDVNGEVFPMLVRVKQPGVDVRFSYSGWSRDR